MNDLMWAFEYETQRIKEEKRAEEVREVFKAVRLELITLLGLNLLPLEDENGLLRRPGENEFIPLSIMTAREGFVEAFVKRQEEMAQQEKAAEELEKEKTGESEAMSPEDLDAFMKEDITFLDNPEEMAKYAAWVSPESEWIKNNVVKPLEEEKKIVAEKEPVMKVSIQSEPVEETRPVSKSKRRVVIASG